MRPVLGVVDGEVARCGTDVAKSAGPARPRLWTRTLSAVEASPGGEWCALGYLGEVLVEEDPGDQFLA